MLLVLNDDIFPKNLIYLRKKRRLSQVKLAQQTGINVYLLRGIENGRFCSQLPCSQYLRLCRTLCVSPSVMGSYDLKTFGQNVTEPPENRFVESDIKNGLSETGHPVLGVEPFDL